MSRAKGLAGSIIRKIDILCIDEIHTVGEERGAVLEAIISRFKLMAIADGRRGPRIVAVSATIKNVDDIADWLCDSNGPAQIHNFGDSLRTVPLHRHVFGYPMNGMNAYQFENSLSTRISWLIEKYSNGLPCLVFCSTRKSAESTANYLARTFEPRKDSNSAVFTEKKLDALVAKGIAFHNAGLLFEDRRTIEFMFTSGKLRVLCATSTLAVGVNLPAHMVIIKGTKQYTGNGYEEYSQIDIQQMMGRAGRPRFDTFGVAVILTTAEMKYLYEQDPQYPIIESR
jgi:ATP-dependent DNA helicase HFM1/MER3